MIQKIHHVAIAVKSLDEALRFYRDTLGLTIIEGYREILRAAENGHGIQELFVCRGLFQGTNEDALIATCVASGALLADCAEPVFARMSYRDRPDGLLAVAPQVSRTLADIDLPADPLIVVAESIEKPGNLGTILRSADAACADAAVVFVGFGQIELR